MIVEEIIDERLVKHYSDSNVMLRQIETERLFADPIDVRPCRFTYEETNIPIEDDTTAEELLSILTGGDA